MSSLSLPDVLPRQAGELVNTFAHYYRAEMQRAISWRDRLDRTTNWAIAAATGILSVSLNEPEKHHGLLLFAMAMVFLLLVIESRRYRFFDIYRKRVRLFETGYYAAILDPASAAIDSRWLAELGENIRTPRVTLTMQQAMAHRLRRNYCWIFLILLAAWLLKVAGSLAFTQVWATPSNVHLQAQIGWTPGWVVFAVVFGFYGWLGYVMVRHSGATRDPVVQDV
jgi:uncharacterized membrane protein